MSSANNALKLGKQCEEPTRQKRFSGCDQSNQLRCQTTDDDVCRVCFMLIIMKTKSDWQIMYWKYVVWCFFGIKILSNGIYRSINYITYDFVLSKSVFLSFRFTILLNRRAWLQDKKTANQIKPRLMVVSILLGYIFG